MKVRFGEIDFDGDSEAQLKANLIQVRGRTHHMAHLLVYTS